MRRVGHLLAIFLLFVMLGEIILAKDNKFSLAISYENHIQDNTPIDVVGLNFEYFLTDRISLNYNYNFSMEPHVQVRHTPIMSYLGWELLFPVLRELGNENEEETSDPSWAISAFLLSLAIPEGLNFHFPWRDNDNTGIILSVNPLGFDYYNDVETFSSGLSMQARFGIGERFFISPMAGFNYAYKPNEFVFRIGVLAGLVF